MSRLLYFAFFTICGYFFVLFTGIQHAEQTDFYHWTIYTLLALGLYSSTYQIERSTGKKQFLLILQVITLGVLFKVLLIGGLLFIIFKDPIFLLLGVAVAQIDPLSVSALLNLTRMSQKARNILASWSSFDDPITVLLAVLVGGIVTMIDYPQASLDVGTLSFQQLLHLGYNLIFAGSIFVLKRLVRTNDVALYLLVFISIFIAVFYQLMLGIALIGLFLRPSLKKLIFYITNAALWIATIMLGMLLIQGINFVAGILVALAAFIAQIIVGFLLTHRLPTTDRIYLALSQQNGVTAIVLALMFEPQFPGMVAIIAPAIFFINLLHLLSNRIVEQFIK